MKLSMILRVSFLNTSTVYEIIHLDRAKLCSFVQKIALKNGTLKSNGVQEEIALHIGARCLQNHAVLRGSGRNVISELGKLHGCLSAVQEPHVLDHGE
jgi:hypothetical protein